MLIGKGELGLLVGKGELGTAGSRTDSKERRGRAAMGDGTSKESFVGLRYGSPLEEGRLGWVKNGADKVPEGVRGGRAGGLLRVGVNMEDGFGVRGGREGAPEVEGR